METVGFPKTGVFRLLDITSPCPRGSQLKVQSIVQYSEVASQKHSWAIGKVLDEDSGLCCSELGKSIKKQAEALLSSTAEDKHDEFFENKTFKSLYKLKIIPSLLIASKD